MPPEAAAMADQPLQSPTVTQTKHRDDKEIFDDPEAGASPTSEEKLPKDPNLVSWDGPDDKENPKNWAAKTKWGFTVTVSAFTFISPVASTRWLRPWRILLRPCMQRTVSRSNWHCPSLSSHTPSGRSYSGLCQKCMVGCLFCRSEISGTLLGTLVVALLRRRASCSHSASWLVWVVALRLLLVVVLSGTLERWSLPPPNILTPVLQ